jgi:hypothetical protein
MREANDVPQTMLFKAVAALWSRYSTTACYLSGAYDSDTRCTVGPLSQKDCDEARLVLQVSWLPVTSSGDVPVAEASG